MKLKFRHGLINSRVKLPSRSGPTWFPSYGFFFPAAEANFAEDAEDVALAQRARVFTGTRASLVRGDFVAVGLSRLTLLSDQGAGDGRCHLPEKWAEPPGWTYGLLL